MYVLYKNPPKSFLVMYVIAIIQTEAIYLFSL